VLRALEMEAQVILKATNVDGVYTADPKKDPNAKFLPTLTFQQALGEGVHPMGACLAQAEGMASITGDPFTSAC